MKQEYPVLLDNIKLFYHDGKTDVILRKNITEVEKAEEIDGEERTYTVYACDEVQYCYPGKLTKAEIEADFDSWWDWEPETNTEEAEVTEEERIAALEAAVLELAEVITGG